MIGFAKGPFGSELLFLADSREAGIGQGRAFFFLKNIPISRAPEGNDSGHRQERDGINDCPRGTIAGPNPSASLSPELQGCSFFVNAYPLGLSFLPPPMIV
jgi:hypothetical protein